MSNTFFSLLFSFSFFLKATTMALLGFLEGGGTEGQNQSVSVYREFPLRENGIFDLG